MSKHNRKYAVNANGTYVNPAQNDTDTDTAVLDYADGLDIGAILIDEQAILADIQSERFADVASEIPTVQDIPTAEIPDVPTAQEIPTAEIAYRLIPTEQIISGDNDRHDFNMEGLQNLAMSIQRNGLAQPILVRPIGLSDTYEIVAGERRFRAMSFLLRKSEIPCLVQELGDERASELMLTENTSRADLNAMDEARAYQKRIGTYFLSVQQMAELAGVNFRTVEKRLSLLQLAEEIQILVAHGNLPLGHAEAMAELDHNRQISALRILQSQKKAMPVALFAEVCEKLKGEENQEQLFEAEFKLTADAKKGVGTPQRGKNMILRFPTRTDMPKVILSKGKGTTASTAIEDYIVRLQEAGMTGEAATIGTLFTELCQGCLMKPRLRADVPIAPAASA